MFKLEAEGENAAFRKRIKNSVSLCYSRPLRKNKTKRRAWMLPLLIVFTDASQICLSARAAVTQAGIAWKFGMGLGTESNLLPKSSHSLRFGNLIGG